MKTIVLTFCGFLVYSASAANTITRTALNNIERDGTLTVAPWTHADTVSNVLGNVLN